MDIPTLSRRKLGAVSGPRTVGPVDARAVRRARENSPHWYLEMQGVAIDQQWDPRRIRCARRARARSRARLPYFAVSESNYLLPKWYGKPGDTERYAAQVADRIGGDEGDAVYFRSPPRLTAARGLRRLRCRGRGCSGASRRSKLCTNRRITNAMSWPTWPCAAATAPLHSKLFTRIGNDWSESVWKTKAAFDAARAGKAIGNSGRAAGDTVTIIQSDAGAPPREAIN